MGAYYPNFTVMNAVVSTTALSFQDGNALIDSSGSCFRDEDAENGFFALIEIETGKALGLRHATTAPDAPIVALPPNGRDSQKWKYWSQEISVRIKYLTFLF